MPTPEGGYWLDGKRLPSVTTVLWPYNPDGNEGLINWAVKLALEGQEYPGIAAKNHREERDRAGVIGNMAHAAVEAWAKGKEPKFELPEEYEKEHLLVAAAKNAYSGFLAWSDDHRIKITHTEVSLKSKRYKFGGTIDAVGLSGNGRRIMLDWKTSNYLKLTMAWQLAAYGVIWNENYPDDPITGGFHLLGLNKNTTAYTAKFWTELENEFVGFQALLTAHHCAKITKIKFA